MNAWAYYHTAASFHGSPMKINCVYFNMYSACIPRVLLACILRVFCVFYIAEWIQGNMLKTHRMHANYTWNTRIHRYFACYFVPKYTQKNVNIDAKKCAICMYFTYNSYSFICRFTY